MFFAPYPLGVVGGNLARLFRQKQAIFRLQLKKVRKSTRPFTYELNQIPYDYIVEMRNRFNGLDLIDRVPDELWTEVRDIVQETGIKTIPKKKKCKKAKWLSEEALQIAALNMPANLENSAVATGLEKVSFHSSPKARQCQRMFKLPHNCTHLTY